jgi:phosphatidate cytidylyltransferase
VSRPGDLTTRLGVAAVGIPVVLGALVLDGWILGGLMALTALIGASEFYGMRRLSGERPFREIGALGAAAAVLIATGSPTVDAFAIPALGLLLGLYAASFAVALRLRWPGGSPIGAASTTVSGVLYVGVPLAFVPILRALPVTRGAGDPETILPAMGFILLPLLVTWANDSAAYFVGHAVGRNKLFPSLSPGKTWEGAVGGVAGSIAAAVTCAAWFLDELPVLTVTLEEAAVIGAVIGIVAQVGDLVESALKREAGVKDSGRVFPGHGGVLDRVDSLIWTFPFTWLMLELLGVIP